MYLYLGNERVVVGKWIVDVISFQKIFGLCCLKCHKVEILRTDNGRRTEREDIARILKTEFAKVKMSKCL